MTTCLHMVLGVSGSTPKLPGVKIQNGGGFPSWSYKHFTSTTIQNWSSLEGNSLLKTTAVNLTC